MTIESPFTCQGGYIARVCFAQKKVHRSCTFDALLATNSYFRLRMAPSQKSSKELARKSGNLMEQCSICSDKASSHCHYGTTKICFSCRAFFRRVVRKKKVLLKRNCNRVSTELGKCPMTVKTRHLCW